MLWIKEVEMVDSGEDLKSSRSTQGYHFPDFEMLDAKIASALNKITQNSYLKKTVSPEEQKVQLQDRSLQKRQIAFTSEQLALMILFLITPIQSVLLFATMMFRNSIRGGTKICYQ